MPSGDGWLGLEQIDADRWSFELTGGLTRFDGKLYGGTGLAVVTALAEMRTGRDALWSTVQFISSVDLGARIDCGIEVLAAGHRTSQLRFTAAEGDRVVFAGLAATGAPRSNGLDLQVGQIPAVTPPDDSRAWTPRAPFTIPEEHHGWFATLELREAEPVPGSTVGPGLTLWARMRTASTTHATLAFVADLVPSAVVRAAGRAGGGSSLDNAMRFGQAPTTEWVLIQLEPHFARAGYVHGAARLWSRDGALLGVASQTAVAIVLD